MAPHVLLLTSSSAPGFHVAPSLGLHRLRHHLEAHGFACVIHDLDLDPEAPVLALVGQGHFDVVGFSVSHINMSQDLDRLWRYRHADTSGKVLWVAGGQEATLNAAQFLEAGFDLVLAGFGEAGLLELCQRLRDGRVFPEITAGLPGAILRSPSGEITTHPVAPLNESTFRQLSYVAPMDMDLPYPRYWEKIRQDMDAHTFSKGRFVVENIRLFTSSHCPRRCGFCSSQSFLPASQGQVLPILAITAEEIFDLLLDHHRRYGIRGVLFSDDDFLLGTSFGLERAFKLCTLIQRAKQSGGLPLDLMLNCQSRIADFLLPGPDRPVHTALIEVMSSSGFHSVGLGVETFSDRLLEAPSICKGGIKAKDCTRVLDALLAAGMCPQINIILGIPESSVDDLIETLEITLGYILRGCQVATTPYILTIPGAPITLHADYQVVTKSWHHPLTNRVITISDHLVPRNAAIREAMETLDADTIAAEARLAQTSGWSAPTLPKTVLGLARFIALARRLGAGNLAQTLEETTDRLLAEATATSRKQTPCSKEGN